MTPTGLMWIIAALLAVFSATGCVLVCREMARLKRSAPRRPRRSLLRRFDDYLGPTDRRSAALNPAGRVAVEFGCGLCGFPGLGWLAAGVPRIGLPLIIVVPALVWALFPLLVSFAGYVYERPLQVFLVLPAIAVLSALSLCVYEVSERSA